MQLCSPRGFSLTFDRSFAVLNIADIRRGAEDCRSGLDAAVPRSAASPPSTKPSIGHFRPIAELGTVNLARRLRAEITKFPPMAASTG